MFKKICKNHETTKDSGIVKLEEKTTNSKLARSRAQGKSDSMKLVE